MNRSFLTSRSCEFEQPITLKPYWFEDLDFAKWTNFVGQHPGIPLLTPLCYMALIFSLQRFMKNRTPLNVRKTLVLWNLGMGIFAIVGFCRVTPEMYKIWSSSADWSDAWYNTVCLRGGFNPPMFAWGMIFIPSKFVELGDTIFIILKKQPLIFLHWYHHAITFVLCWVTIQYCEPIFRIFLGMNLLVHAIMYPYFALKTMRVHIPKSFSMFLTTLQLVQMFLGVWANVYTISILYNGGDCIRHPESIKWFGGVYLSFAFLFAKFLYSNYFSNRKRKNE